MKLCLALLLLAACGPAEPDAVVVYSGRKSVLVDPVLEAYRAGGGTAAEPRFGRDAELLAALAEEGANSPADVFWSNTAGALGAAANEGLLAPLPDSLLRLPGAFVPSSGLWVPVTARFRVLAYNPARVDTAALPASALDLPRLEGFEGRIGWTPTYSSFQDFITAMRLLHGEDTTRAWVEGMRALEPKAYESNAPMLEALAAGEIDLALTNHYYVLRAHIADSTNVDRVAMRHFAPGDVGNLALVTGAGVLNTADDPAAAERFLAFLLSPEAQAMGADKLREYPVTAAAETHRTMMPYARAVALSPDLDFEGLRDLEGTLALLRDQGLL